MKINMRRDHAPKRFGRGRGIFRKTPRAVISCEKAIDLRAQTRRVRIVASTRQKTRTHRSAQEGALERCAPGGETIPLEQMRFFESGHHCPVTFFGDIHPVEGFTLRLDILKRVATIEPLKHGNQRHGSKKNRIAETKRIAEPQHPLALMFRRSSLHVSQLQSLRCHVQNSSPSAFSGISSKKRCARYPDDR